MRYFTICTLLLAILLSTTAVDAQHQKDSTLTFVISNELGNKNEGGLIDYLVSAGYGDSSVYSALQYLKPNSGGVISDEFMANLASCPANSDIFMAPLSAFADSSNNPAGIGSDGSFIVAPIYGRDYIGKEGYATFPESQTGNREKLFTYATSPDYYIDAGAQTEGGVTTYYKVFAIAWRDSTITGVADGNITKESLIISPNPASDYIEINTARWSPSNKSSSKPSEGYIYNTLGECVINYELQITNYDNGIKINVSNLPVGAFYLRIGNLSCKFIIAR